MEMVESQPMLPVFSGCSSSGYVTGWKIKAAEGKTEVSPQSYYLYVPHAFINP